jgi:uncharacterized 2Fe-2S/4Fe-4S cluster protein (DUF4445 family)
MTVLAIDLGTTNISLALAQPGTRPGTTGDGTHADTGTRLGQLVLPNPQIAWGTDVMTRLLAAADSPSDAASLQRAVVVGIGRAVGEVCAGAGLAPIDVTSVAVVGNTAMLALLTGRRFALLLDPSHWMTFVDCEPVPRAFLRRSWGLSAGATIEILPSLAGFVGSDLLAGILYTRLRDVPEPALLTDIGTNSEIALWDGQQIWATSAAGGPAFEGVGVECGMAALPGAVMTVRLDPGGRWQVETLGGGTPVGICGCGLVDVIALLRQDGRLSDIGRMNNVPGNRIHLPGTSLSITTKDVDLLMRAKAAIAAGCELLGQQAGIGAGELVSVQVAGAMGAHLDPRHAMEIGLIPPVDLGRVRIRGNTALAGCEEYLLSPQVRRAAQEARGQVLVSNLASADSFEESFFANLPLRPQRPWQ